MTKHLSFWLGVFAAALLTVPIAASIMGAAEQELRRIAVTVFVAVAALVVVLVIALFFRDWILRRLFGRAEATLDDVSASLIAGVSAATAGDRAAATQHAQEVVQRGMGWYAWTGFYRWVIATAVALLLAFGAFMGTVLLFEQNRKLGEQTEVLRVQTERLAEQTGFMAAQTELMQAQTERLREQTEAAAMQNEILTLNLVNEIRDLMLATVETRTLGEWLEVLGRQGTSDPLASYASDDATCSLYFNFQHVLHTPPSAATLGAVATLAQGESMGPRVRDALALLTLDRNGGVALGALLVLDMIGTPKTDNEVTLRNLFVEERVELQSDAHVLRIEASYLGNFACPDCDVYLSGSYYLQLYDGHLNGRHNIFDGRDPNKFMFNGLTLRDRERPQTPTALNAPLVTGPFFDASKQVWLVRLSGDEMSVCDSFQRIALRSPILQATAPALD
ncbi:hypothetical protein [Tateyamaria sp. syn59]|uniref:hypothetical protein n=1 Tax=Tateyamaria sp. syn59 TaxID=2576942 RepID=UPI0011BF77FB|nr:hypothetical protein [Tateyamaria sp. syn59]